MKILPDGSLLIHTPLDGPFEPVVRAKRGVVSTGPKSLNSITQGRPSNSDQQQAIKDLIKQMQVLKPQLTFVQCWNILQRERPELFD